MELKAFPKSINMKRPEDFIICYLFNVIYTSCAVTQTSTWNETVCVFDVIFDLIFLQLHLMQVCRLHTEVR